MNMDTTSEIYTEFGAVGHTAKITEIHKVHVNHVSIHVIVQYKISMKIRIMRIYHQRESDVLT